MSDNKEIQDVIIDVEQAVCDFFALPYDEVFSKNITRDRVLARHFTIYLLHKDYGISINKLSKKYNHAPRHINRICVWIGNRIQYDKKCQNYYNCLKQYIKREG